MRSAPRTYTHSKRLQTRCSRVLEASKGAADACELLAREVHPVSVCLVSPSTASASWPAGSAHSISLSGGLGLRAADAVSTGALGRGRRAWLG